MLQILFAEHGCIFKLRFTISEFHLGDLFEKEEDIKDSDIWLKIAGSENPTLQYKNRQKILQLADYVIPGHGAGFHIFDELKKHHESLEFKFK